MKTTPLLITIMSFLIISKMTSAQENWNYYSKVLDVKNYQGLPFRMQATVKTDIVDDDASARLWVRVDKKGDIGFFDNMWYKPIRNKSWKTYSIEGVIDTGAYRVLFGTLCQFNGKFYLDNLRFDVKKNSKSWKNIYSEDFETPKDSVQKYLSGGENPFFKAEILNDSLKNHCFMVTGNGVPNFGTNKTASDVVDVNGIKMYYEIYGEGHPLVVLHGNGCSIETANPLYTDLIKKYKVIAVDSRAQGKSTDTDQPLTYEQMALDVNALLDKLNIDSAYIWGHSDGAVIGLILAMNHPEKVKKLLAVAANIQPDTTALFPFVVDFIHSKYQTTEAVEKKLNKLMMDYPNIPFSKLSQIKAPVLIMTGDRDMVRPEHTLKLFQNIPNAQLCILPGATVWSCWDKKEMFLSLLYNFFDKPFSMPDSRRFFK